MKNIRTALRRLNFRTGVTVLVLCVPCYIASFAQMALPIDAGLKAILWVVFFGLAKCFQYAGLAIVGVKGWQRIKSYFRLRRKQT